MAKQTEFSIIGSRDEGEVIVGASNKYKTQQERYDGEWERIQKGCAEISGVDENGMLNTGTNPSFSPKTFKESMGRSGLFYYKNTIINGKHATEYIYLTPTDWGILEFGEGKWHDKDGLTFKHPNDVDTDWQQENIGKDVIVRIVDGKKESISGQEYGVKYKH